MNGTSLNETEYIASIVILVDSSNLLALTYDQSPPSMTYNELLQTVTDLSQQRYQAYER